MQSNTDRWRETTTVGRKKRKRRCASGKPGSKKTCQRIGQAASTILQQPLSAAAVTALESLFICVCKRPREKN